MELAAEVPAVPVPEGLDALMPAWAQQLSLVGLLVLIVAAWISGRVLTRAQADREVEAERRIADVWKTNFESAIALTEQITEGFQPVLDQNAAILRAIEALQERQRLVEEREDRERWMRDRRDRPE